jgi:hypothetical protein
MRVLSLAKAMTLSQVSLADATYNDLGSKVRRFWGLGGFQNITLETLRMQSIR